MQEKKDTSTEFGKKCYGKKIERQTCNEKPCISNPPSISDFESANSKSPILDKGKGKHFLLHRYQYKTRLNMLSTLGIFVKI